MHITYIQVFRGKIHHKSTSDMHNLKTNFDKFCNITKSVLKDRLNMSDNFFFYQNESKLSDCKIILLSVTDESIEIDSENYLCGKLKSDHRSDFPILIDRSNFYHRRNHLHPFVEQLNRCIAGRLNESEDVYLVDSIAIPVCLIERERQSKICKDSIETTPDKGYSEVSKSYYSGYKLHLVTYVSGIFQSMDLTKANVHDIHYLLELKKIELYSCHLIADKGYLSSTYQIDLFNSCLVNLQTTKRANQERQPYPLISK